MDTKERTLMDDMRDDGYRFSYDLITDVVKRKGIYVPRVNFSNPENLLLTTSRKRIIKEFLAQKAKYIQSLVEDYALRCGGSDYKYSDFNYFHNRFIVIEEFKPEPYSEEGFVKLCAAIAQVAVCNYVRNKNYVLMHAMNDVHNLVKKVLSRGTLQQSSWTEDYEYF